MPRKQTIDAAARTHLLCYLVASALASYALTSTWRVDHVVESARIWLARNDLRSTRIDVLKRGVS
jgi:hypothetical protein